MSMIGNVAGATDAQIAALHTDPSLVTPFLHDGEPLEHLGPMSRTMDVDKAWHAIHILLTGEAWTGRRLRASASFSSGEVRALADALAPIDMPAQR
jgi:hypothetical protein